MFFGFSDWMFGGKVDSPAGLSDTDGHLKLSQNGDSDPLNVAGLWEVLNPNPNYQYMLIFKGGDKALPQAVVGYLLDALSGDYMSPFFDLKNLPRNQDCVPQDPADYTDDCYKSKTISHVSIYKRLAPIPIPASLPLIFGAVGALVLVGRRRKA